MLHPSQGHVVFKVYPRSTQHTVAIHPESEALLLHQAVHALTHIASDALFSFLENP